MKLSLKKKQQTIQLTRKSSSNTSRAAKRVCLCSSLISYFFPSHCDLGWHWYFCAFVCAYVYVYMYVCLYIVVFFRWAALKDLGVNSPKGKSKSKKDKKKSRKDKKKKKKDRQSRRGPPPVGGQLELISSLRLNAWLKCHVLSWGVYDHSQPPPGRESVPDDEDGMVTRVTNDHAITAVATTIIHRIRCPAEKSQEKSQEVAQQAPSPCPSWCEAHLPNILFHTSHCRNVDVFCFLFAYTWLHCVCVCVCVCVCLHCFCIVYIVFALFCL